MSEEMQVSAPWDPERVTGTRRMEVTEEKLLEGRATYLRGAVEVFDLTNEESRNVSIKWHDHGWAKCLETGAFTERNPGTVVIEPHMVSQEAL